MTGKISITALFTAFTVILSYVETLIPVIGIPGAKLGLANFGIVLAIYLLGEKEALLINIVRILLIGMLFGNLFSVIYSIAGAVASFLAMIWMKRCLRVSMITVAICGGVFHNIGQLMIAALVVETYSVVTYLPVLIVFGAIAGFLIGFLAAIVYKRIKRAVDNLLKK